MRKLKRTSDEKIIGGGGWGGGVGVGRGGGGWGGGVGGTIDPLAPSSAVPEYLRR